MICGIGTDIVTVARIASIHDRFAARFVRRILTESEHALYNERPACERPVFLAGRFAAKEALAKALGCGIGAQFSFTDAAFLPDTDGAPHCVPTPCCRALFTARGITHSWVSIAHEKAHIACATVVLEKQEYGAEHNPAI